METVGLDRNATLARQDSSCDLSHQSGRIRSMSPSVEEPDFTEAACCSTVGGAMPSTVSNGLTMPIAASTSGWTMDSQLRRNLRRSPRLSRARQCREHNSHVNSAMRSIRKQLATNFSIPFQAGHGLCLFGVILWATYIQPFSLSRCHAVRTCSALITKLLALVPAWTPPTAAFGSFLAAGSSPEANALSPEAPCCMACLKAFD